MAQQPTVWRGKTLVNPQTAGNQIHSKIIGLSNGNVLVVYADSSSNTPGIGVDVSGVIYNATGAVVRQAFQVNTASTSNTETLPSIGATNDGGFIMAYEDATVNGVTLRAERYNSGGVSLSSAVIASAAAPASVGPAVVAVNKADNSFFVTYESYDGGTYDPILGRKFNSFLAPVGGERIVRDDGEAGDGKPVSEPRDNDTSVLSNGSFVTVYEDHSGTLGAIKQINATVSAVDGAPIVVFNVAVGPDGADLSDPAVAALRNGFAVVWAEPEETSGSANDNIKYRIYDTLGSPLTGVLTAVDSTSHHVLPDVIGLPDGTVFIAWHDQTEGDIEGRLYDGATGAAIGDAINIETTGGPEAVDLGATTDGRILITYRTVGAQDDVHFEIFDPRSGDTVVALPGQGQVTGLVTATNIYGSSASERLIGRNGDDLIIHYETTLSPTNIDAIDGGGGGNTFEVANFTGKAIVDLQAGVLATGSIAQTQLTRATLVNIDNVTIGGALDMRGDDSANVLRSNGNHANEIHARGGADTILAGAGDDVLVGGAGGDSLDGEAGNDTASYANAGSAIQARLTTGVGLDGDAQGDTYANIENLTGSAFADTLVGSNGVANKLDGGAGNDTMIGNSGNDILTGGLGKDTLLGGVNNDAFVFASAADSAAGANRDAIHDFEDAGENDSIVLTGFAGTLSFIGTAAFSAANQVRATQSGIDVLIEINTTGNSGAESEILLVATTLAQVDATDFFL